MAHKKFAPLLFLFSKPALALDMDYYTYDGFSQTVDAFKKIALVFGDSNYVVLFTIFAILGIFVGGMVAYGKSILAMSSGQPGQINLSWLVLPILGTLFFKGLITPKANIHIYDEKLNAYQEVSGVPSLVALAAGGMNKIERAIIRIIDNNSASPYTKDAGGLSFKLLYDATTNVSDKSDFYLMKSLKQFYADCSPIALANNANTFNLSQIRSKTTDLMTDLAKLKNPAIFTTYFDAQNSHGEVLSCKDTWDKKLKPILNNASTVEQLLKSVCTVNHFNMSDVTQSQECGKSLDRAIGIGYNKQIGHKAFLRNSLIATAIANIVQDDNPDVGVRALTNRAMLNEGVGVAIAAENWFPTIKAIVTAILLGLLPILLLFLVTPLFPKVLNLTFSLFAWVALWGITDAFLHQGTTEQMINAFSNVQNHQMGLLAFWNSPDYAMKAMAIMGQARSMGIMIATFLAATFFGLNAYAFSSIAERWSTRVDSEGTKSADITQSPEKAANYVDSLAASTASSAAYSHFGFDSMVNAAAFSKSTGISSGLSASGLATGNAITAGESIGGTQGAMNYASASATQTMEKLIGQRSGLSNKQAWEFLGIYNSSGSIADINASEGNVSEMLHYKSDAAKLNMASQDAYLDEAASNGLKGTDLKRAQAEFSAGREAALIEASNAIGLTPSQIGMSKEGANWSLALDSNQANALYEQGHLTGAQKDVLSDGGVLNFGFTTNNGFNVATSSAQSGHSASQDDGLKLNSQTSIMRGAYAAGGASSIEATTSADDVETILQTNNGKLNLAINSATALESMYDIKSSSLDQKEWTATIQAGGGVGLSGSLGGSMRGVSQQTQDIKPVIGLYSNMINAIYSEADDRGLSQDIKDAWVANELATLNKTIYEKIDGLAVSQSGDTNFSFAISEYFENRGLSTAANSIEKHSMSYKYGGVISEDFLEN